VESDSDGSTSSDEKEMVGRAEPTITSTSIPVPSQYENRFVAFLDILGWREQIERSKRDSSEIPKLGAALLDLKINSDMREWVEHEARARAATAGQAYTLSPEDIQFAQFSDTIVISAAAAGSGSISLLHRVQGINQQLFGRGQLARGAITAGAMYHKGSIAFGPALTAAYDLERKSSIHPRIIIDPALENVFLRLQTISEGGRPVGNFNWIRRSPDGFYFVDFLAPMGPKITAKSRASDDQFLASFSEADDQFLASQLNHARAAIMGGLKKFRYSSIWDKYRWLAEYFNVIAAEYPGASIEPISLE
jgi:hypothetical protein